jgi:hypothetical protein
VSDLVRLLVWLVIGTFYVLVGMVLACLLCVWAVCFVAEVLVRLIEEHQRSKEIGT